MKKTKILTVLGVLLAMGITACGGKPADESKPSGKSSDVQPASDTSAPAPQKDATGHAWGADTDVAASGEGVAYKKAECAEKDGFIRIKVNESAVTNADRKSGTPDGYLKLSGDGKSCSFKFNFDHYAEGQLFLFGVMDGYSSNYTKNAFYVNGTPNVEVKINNEVVDISARKDVKFQDIFGEPIDGESLSAENYALLGNIAINEGVNELIYKRVQTLNMLVKDFVLVVKNADKPAHTHTADTEWHKDATNHWHECTAGDGFKMDSAAHTFGKWEEHASAQPCKEKGTKTRACSVCGYVETAELDLAEHTWVADDSKTDVPATCIAGKHFEKCSVCGETREVAIPKNPDADHDFGEWEIVTPASCKQGQKKRVCSRCGMEDFAVIPPVEGAEHVWGEKETVADVTHVDETDPENPVTVIDYIGYDKYVCQTCGTWRVILDASKATVNGTLKADTNIPTGRKLSNNNEYFTFKFKFDTKADVVIYQHGCMDNWGNHTQPTSGNKDVTYWSLKSGKQGDGVTTNFKFEVNGVVVDMEDMRGVTSGQACPNRPDDDPLVDSYSDFADLLIGESELKVGDNEFKYTRINSYNYIIDSLVLEVTPLDHDHEASENWVDTDDTYHWKNCTHSDGHKMEKAKHDYTGQEWEIVEPSTCSKKGTRRRSCIVCGHWQVEEMPLAEHAYVEDTAQYVAPTHNATGKKVEVCSACGDVKETILPKVPHEFTEGASEKNTLNQDVTALSCSCGASGYQMKLTDCDNSGEIKSGKVTNGKTLTWHFKVAQAGKISFVLKAALNTGGDAEFANGGTKGNYTLKAGTKTGTITCAGKKLSEYGATSSQAVYFEMGIVEFAAEDIDENGEIAISVTWPTTQDWRHVYSENVRMIYLAE